MQKQPAQAPAANPVNPPQGSKTKDEHQRKLSLLRPVYVVRSAAKKLKVSVHFQTESVEVWLKEDTECRGQQICRALVFKLQLGVLVGFQEHERVLLVSVSKPAAVESERDYILDASLQQVVRIIDNDIDVNVQASNINISQTLTTSWVDMTTILLTPALTSADTKFLQNDLMEPTSISVSLLSSEQYKLSRQRQLEVKVKPLVLRLDYKDVDLLYTISKKAERILDHIEEKDLFKNFS